MVIKVRLWRASEAKIDEWVVVDAALCARVAVGVSVVASEIVDGHFEGHGNGRGEGEDFAVFGVEIVVDEMGVDIEGVLDARKECELI